jgi:hypothetical protein
MPSTYTGLGTQLMVTGENAGTWGTKTNTNLNIIEQISGGYLSQALNTTGATTLAVSDGAATDANQVGHRILNFTAALAGNVTVTIPLDVEQFYIIKNSTTNAYSVEFKYVTGSGGSVTWVSGDRGTKIVYATANDGTNPDIIDATTDYVTATSTTTLTNKTLTAPKIVSGGFIADAGGDENLVFTEVSTPVNELRITNAATGSGPILAAISTSATDSNIDLNINPLGTGVLKSGTAAVKIAGKETMWVPAPAMYASTTNGAEAAQAELTAGNPELKTFDFDTSTAESVQFNVSFPKSWNESTVTFQTFWSASATDAGTGGFTLAGVSIANDVDYDTAFGTAVANTALAASGTQDDLMVNVESGNVTIASAAAATNTIFRLVRDTGTDTNTGDLRLVGIKIFYTTDAANDA